MSRVLMEPNRSVVFFDVIPRKHAGRDEMFPRERLCRDNRAETLTCQGKLASRDI